MSDDDYGDDARQLSAGGAATSRQASVASRKAAAAAAAADASKREAKGAVPPRDRKDPAALKVLSRDACWECKQSKGSPSDAIVFCE
jgi:hypothetical protein